MSNNTAFQNISSDQLTDVSGGISWGWVKPAARIIGKKALGPASAAYSGYCAVDKFMTDREHHKSLRTSLIDAGKAAVF